MKDFTKEVKETSNWLSQHGAVENNGMTRLLYTQEWISAQRALKNAFESSGLYAYYDDIGNLFGQLKGRKYPDQVILSGSHIDTVINGGNLDGQFGIEAAFIALDYLQKTYGQPLRTLEVVSLAEEEGSRFPYVYWGSKNIVGIAKKEDVKHISDAEGVNFVDAMSQAGFKFRPANQKPRSDIKTFVELHIEQGNVLEREHITIGVVNSIVGQRRYNITLKGEANHAGTTPMGYRKDTICAFSRICYESTEKAKQYGDPLVLTFGRVVPHPNTVNVVPGQTDFTIDCRHTDKATLVEFTAMIENDIQRICAEMGIEVKIDLWMDEAPIPMDEQLVTFVKKICDENQYSYKVMHSGAGHDSQIFAPIVPTVMMFVPSIKGISHNPAEATTLSDLAEGVKLLTEVLYKLAYLE
ncbi:allantoate deiminase [Providencia rettgeri]|uniref:allantoate deiminase n=1 Tax=Providencia rettgeri TaxID=587 RepID=UPI0018E4C3D9|nr:allantoate deiminase [Providencia rettgeri]MBI6189358.1 allantoate deiminase [Providencia rettgeri]